MIDAFASVGASTFNVSWIKAHVRKPARPLTLCKTLAALGEPLPHADNTDWLDTVHIDGIPTDDLRRTVPALLATSTNERTAISSRKPKTAMGVRLRNAKIPYMAFPKIAEEGGGR
jgi:hypothetical protein